MHCEREWAKKRETKKGDRLIYHIFLVISGEKIYILRLNYALFGVANGVYYARKRDVRRDRPFLHILIIFNLKTMRGITIAENGAPTDIFNSGFELADSRK